MISYNGGLTQSVMSNPGPLPGSTLVGQLEIKIMHGRLYGVQILNN